MNLYGFFFDAPLFTLAIFLVGALALGFLAAPFLAWALFGGFVLMGLGAPTWLFVVWGIVAAIGLLRPLRKALVSGPLMRMMKALKFLPVISETERVAIEAGTVWVDGDLFSGSPDFEKLLKEPYPELSAKEQAFLDGPVEELCRLADDWQIWQERDLPEEVWDFLKKEKFLGMIVPEEYGGLGFSPSANSAIIKKISSRSAPLSITVMVPNSLGPAELLSHYGTKEQKERWLPRLANGEEIPAFALTEPNAGSDAGAISANGVIFRGDDGELYVRLNWKKRYITLAAISTVLGLAFKLRDPEGFLSRGEDLGITCALIPTVTDGVVLGQRHDPLGVPFYNCPTEGHDVVVPLDAIIGGADGAGRGWQMLMETLSAGRGIALPALSTAIAQGGMRISGAYSSVRKQFGLAIGKFEGIHEPMARIGGAAYTLEAARRATCGGLDSGARPAVVTAIAKYNFTEIGRQAINDAMDVLGGAAISRGPRNTLAHAYIATPISITVEGANILTRTLMIFGQGAIRCHPYAYREIKAAAANDAREFDSAFWGHVGHVVDNACRSVVLSVTRGWLAKSPVDGPAAKYYRKMAWSSASFAVLADIAMAGLGGDLKRKETITGRFSDIFSWMYLANATLLRFEKEGRRKEDVPFFEWAMEDAFANIQKGFDGLFANLTGIPVVGWILRYPIGLWSRLNAIGSQPNDRLTSRVARAMQEPGAVRDRLTEGLYRPQLGELGLGEYEQAFLICHRAETVAGKIKDAVRAKTLPRKKPAALLGEALEKGVITQEEHDLVKEAEAARDSAIAVDSFSLDEYMRGAVPAEPPAMRTAS